MNPQNNDRQDITPLENGSFEVLITKAFGQDEQFQVRATIKAADEFEPMRKMLYEKFINPRSAEHAREVIDYQQAMALAQEEVNSNVEAFRAFVKSNKENDNGSSK